MKKNKDKQFLVFKKISFLKNIKYYLRLKDKFKKVLFLSIF